MSLRIEFIENPEKLSPIEMRDIAGGSDSSPKCFIKCKDKCREKCGCYIGSKDSGYSTPSETPSN